MRTRKKKDWMWFLFVIGDIFMVVGCYTLAEQITFGMGAVTTTGTIVELRPDGRRRFQNHFVPIVEYVAGKDDELRFEGQSTYLDRRVMEDLYIIGSIVPVIYQPSHPRHARIDNENQRWNVPKGALFIGLGCLTAASLICWKRLANVRKQDSMEAEAGFRNSDDTSYRGS